MAAEKGECSTECATSTAEEEALGRVSCRALNRFPTLPPIRTRKFQDSEGVSAPQTHCPGLWASLAAVGRRRCASLKLQRPPESLPAPVLVPVQLPGIPLLLPFPSSSPDIRHALACRPCAISWEPWCTLRGSGRPPSISAYRPCCSATASPASTPCWRRATMPPQRTVRMGWTLRAPRAPS